MPMSSTNDNDQNDKFKMRVVNYNILSSHLASPSHFTHCDPENLEASNRLPKIMEKIDLEMNNDKGIPAIFCLQEVSHSWAGKFHTFFANKKYHFVTGLYGKRFNNYMGIGIAFPLDTFDVLDVDISRLSDYREGGWPQLDEEEEKKKSKLKSIIQFGHSIFQTGIQILIRPLKSILQIYPETKPIDHWQLSENRQNILLFCRLRVKDKNQSCKKEFCISNYHMPCAFYAPMVMNIHAEMVAKRSQSMASGDPLILAGDFNFMPESSHYKLVTTGDLSKDDVTYPTSKYGMEWKSTIEPMRSAYAESTNGEPDFTNFAQVRDDDPFIGTLDYVFLSKHWDVDDVLKTVHRNESVGPFPNDEEPSDHILLWTDLKL